MMTASPLKWRARIFPPRSGSPPGSTTAGRPPPRAPDAGFCKSGTAIPALAGLGFGAIEIGSVSIDPSFGNPKPRLWRIPADDAIVMHYVPPTDGIVVIAKRLASIRVPV